ncbi:aminodeoxychorismate synthase component I [Verrucomicrobiaceae bacterium N1E253]|uniref:Aminodeoxychorismate synthase component I n=1 Tax=Oceaniferula marina TaxID=2748318 RepID=A0A851GKP8_9BACT|nr:aminodeoxychorismate synthase component I [Oceaniferula marina]NWK55300.1 aminodeoxychorismate synthase component I [Oceaniferula marina]
MATHPEQATSAPPPQPVRLQEYLPENQIGSPEQVAAALQHLPGMLFFDSAGNLPSRSHPPVSIIAARPVDILRGHISDTEALDRALEQYQCHTPSIGFPAGAACGWVDYEGDYCFGIYPEMLIYQHDRKQWWQCGNLARELRPATDTSASPEMGSFQAEMTRHDYESKVRAIHEYIAAGDIYQVNLTQSFHAPARGGSLFPLYQHLRTSSPAPLACWMQLDKREILSSSPETFLRMSGRSIETRPIKGTRPRGSTSVTDAANANELLASEKENAELTMITDLERNDLGQVCDFGTVRVAEMLALETLEQVYHLVSTVTGTLRQEVSHWQALKACFPGGSITGAPKKRAMEIINELEPVPRGLYTGAVGYVSFNGESQFNIPIRTLVRENDHLQYHVGAGIVADSDPAAEYQETLDKAKGIRLAIEQYMKANHCS